MTQLERFSDVLGLRDLSKAVSEFGANARPLAYAATRGDEVGVTGGVREGVRGATGPSAALERRLSLLPVLLFVLQLIFFPVPLNLREEHKRVSNVLEIVYYLFIYFFEFL